MRKSFRMLTSAWTLPSSLLTPLRERPRPRLTAEPSHSGLLILHPYHSLMWIGGRVGVERKKGEESAPSSHSGPQDPSVLWPHYPQGRDSNVFVWWNPLGNLVKLEDHFHLTAREAGTGSPQWAWEQKGRVWWGITQSLPQETSWFKKVEESPKIVHTVLFRKETVSYKQEDSFLETSILRKMVSYEWTFF